MLSTVLVYTKYVISTQVCIYTVAITLFQQIRMNNKFCCHLIWSSLYDILFADQTPTPTRFLRNCEEEGLFEDLENPFDQVHVCSGFALNHVNVNLHKKLSKVAFLWTSVNFEKMYVSGWLFTGGLT